MQIVSKEYVLKELKWRLCDASVCESREERERSNKAMQGKLKHDQYDL